MKKFLLVALSLLLVLPFMAFAAGQKESSTANAGPETVKLTWQIWVTPNLTRETYDGIVADFQASHPGVEIELIELSATSQANAADFARERLAAGDLPDILSNFTDIPSFADEGLLWALPADDPDLKKVKNLMDTAYKGKIYSYMSAIQPQGLVYYNKDLWAKSGLTENDIPATWDEFYAVCDKIKSAGFTPLITSGEWVPVIFMDYMLGGDLTMQFPEFWDDIYAGKLKWNSPEVLKVVKLLDGLVKKGYFNEGALSLGYAQLEQEFLKGNAVMYPMGSWFTAAEKKASEDGTKSWDCGVFAPPTSNGKINVTRSASYGNGYAITSKCENPEVAFDLIKMITLDPEYAASALQNDGMYSNTVPPITYPMTKLQEDLQSLLNEADYSMPILQHRLVLHQPPKGFGDYLTSAGEALLSQSYSSLEDVMQQLDDFIAQSPEMKEYGQQ